MTLACAPFSIFAIAFTPELTVVEPLRPSESYSEPNLHQMTPTLASRAEASVTALSTSFTPPGQCSNSLTMMKGKAYQIWYNELVPVPAETFSDCYAPEIMTSYLKSLGGDVLPAFSPLVCQDDYQTVFSSFIGTDRYIACCPRYLVRPIWPTALT